MTLPDVIEQAMEPLPPDIEPIAGRRVRAAVLAAFVVAAVGFAAFVGYWVASGGRWFIVETPSMGTSAPVGTLLWEKPVGIKDLHVGEFITFRPPGSSTTYSHRVYSINSDGTISTKGQITSPDPWRLHGSDIVGKVEMRWWAVGWLVKAAPLLILGGLVAWLLTARFASIRWRLPLRVISAAVLLAVAIVVYRPLTRAVQLSVIPMHGGGRATYISTGLLPLRLQAAHGGHADIRAGQVGSVVSTHADSRGRYPISLHPHIPFWWWVVLVVACFVPAIWTTIVGRPRDVAPRHLATPTA
jgi:hypothetical protein